MTGAGITDMFEPSREGWWLALFTVPRILFVPIKDDDLEQVMELSE